MRRHVAAEELARRERQLEGAALQVVDEDEGVLRIDAGVLGGRAEQIVRMRREVLVHRRARGHHHRQRLSAPPARAPRLLPHGGDGAGIAREDRHVEMTDVDPQLERARRHHALHLARAQPLLDLAPAQRQIAAPVSAHHPGVARLVLHRALDGGEQDLGGEPALGEDDRGDLLLEKARGELGRLAEIRRADAELRIDDGRVVAEEDLLARRRAALRDLRHRLPGQALGQLARVGDGRRGHDELRRAAVVAADALEPAQHVGEMAAEDPAVRVQLVDHHVAEVLEEVRPLRVVRQDARVQHVGVGQHEVGARAHRAPRVLRRVAVVGEHPHVGQGLGELVQLRELVLGERLGRKQVEDARLGLLDQGLQHGQVVAERLARGRRRHDDDVLPLGHDLDGARLVRVELLHAATLERLDDPGVEGRRKRGVDGGPGVEVTVGRDERARLERGQELVEELPQWHGSSYV